MTESGRPPPETLPPEDARRHRRGVTIMILPDGATGSRTFRLSRRQVRRLAMGLGALTALVLALVVSWGFLAWKAGEAEGLKTDLQEAQAVGAQVEDLARTLERTEAAYDRLRALFSSPGGEGEGPWLPVPGGGGDVASLGLAGAEPTLWPLTVRGFLTQPLVAGAGPGDDHPGIDVAVPSGSYIRAAGSGLVVDAGEDPVYGWFVRVSHGDGLESLYAHAGHLAVGTGDLVHAGEVLGLTGSSGQSTAPHLHFELLRDGAPVDPLEILDRP